MKRLLFIFLLMMSCSSYAVDFRQLSDPKQQESLRDVDQGVALSGLSKPDHSRFQCRTGSGFA